MRMKFKAGELVRWVEEYADGDLVRDVGVGVILNSKQYNYNDYRYTIYQVYRNKRNDIENISEENLQKLKLKGE